MYSLCSAMSITFLSPRCSVSHIPYISEHRENTFKICAIYCGFKEVSTACRPMMFIVMYTRGGQMQLARIFFKVRVLYIYVATKS